MGTVRFVLRTDKKYKDGFAPIQLIYQLHGQRKYYKTRLKIRECNWNKSEQIAIYLDKEQAKELTPDLPFHLLPKAKEIHNINDNLSSLRKDIADIETRFEINRQVYSPTLVIDALMEQKGQLTKTDQPINEVILFIDTYVEAYKETRAPGSLSVFKSLKNHLQSFQNDKKRKITFQNIDYDFFEEFQNYLVTVKELSNTTVAKQLTTIKTFLNYARKKGYEVSDKYRDFKVKRENLEVIALTNDEFDRLYNLDLTGKKKLDQVRDVFCFSCATGLRYSDLHQLKRENIKRDEITITVKKTKQPLTIPLNPYSSAILEKYQSHLKPLPVISNQKTNKYLKDLCKEEDAKINSLVEIVRYKGAKRIATTYPKYELVSVHTGRKTFATLSLEKGMNAEEVMEIGGWKDYKSFKRYVRITEKRKKIVMKNAWGEVKMPILKAV
jgi:integrase